MKWANDELVALLVTVSFAAGLDAHTQPWGPSGFWPVRACFQLPPGLRLLASWWVIAASAAATFSIVGPFYRRQSARPRLDMENALHTFNSRPRLRLCLHLLGNCQPQVICQGNSSRPLRGEALLPLPRIAAKTSHGPGRCVAVRLNRSQTSLSASA